MQVAVSDYDGTLLVDGEVDECAILAIDRWREMGNVFVIATGRSLDWILPEIGRWRIGCDALVCVNGAAIYDADFSALEKNTLPKGMVDKLIHHRAGAASREIQVIARGEVFIAYTRPGWKPPEALPYQLITLRQACDIDNVEQVSYAYSDTTEAAYWLDLLQEDIRDQAAPRRNVANIDVNNHGVDKSAAIASLLKHKGWPESGILVVGDGANDKGMITRYDGATLDSASRTVRLFSRSVYPGVADMLEEAMLADVGHGQQG